MTSPHLFILAATGPGQAQSTHPRILATLWSSPIPPHKQPPTLPLLPHRSRTSQQNGLLEASLSLIPLLMPFLPPGFPSSLCTQFPPPSVHSTNISECLLWAKDPSRCWGLVMTKCPSARGTWEIKHGKGTKDTTGWSGKASLGK